MSQLGIKFEDIRLIYESFKEKLGDTYRTAEELILQLAEVVHEIEGIRDSVICLDGFTGFTPDQYELIARLLQLCQDMYVTVTMDVSRRRKYLFQISEETVTALTETANRIPVEVKEPVWAGRGREETLSFSSGWRACLSGKKLFLLSSGALGGTHRGYSAVHRKKTTG